MGARSFGSRLKHSTYEREGGGVRWEDLLGVQFLFCISWRWAFMRSTITLTDRNRLRHIRHQQTNQGASNVTPDHTGTLVDVTKTFEPRLQPRRTQRRTAQLNANSKQMPTNTHTISTQRLRPHKETYTYTARQDETGDCHKSRTLGRIQDPG